MKSLFKPLTDGSFPERSLRRSRVATLRLQIKAGCDCLRLLRAGFVWYSTGTDMSATSCRICRTKDEHYATVLQNQQSGSTGALPVLSVYSGMYKTDHRGRLHRKMTSVHRIKPENFRSLGAITRLSDPQLYVINKRE